MKHSASLTLAALAALTLIISCASSPDHQEHQDKPDHHAGHHKAEPASAPASAHGHKGHKMPHTFDDAEKWSKIFDNPERDAWQKPVAVVGAMAIAEGMTVADIGAGTGYFLPHLQGAVGESGRVMGLDIEPNLVAHMKGRITEASWKNVTARQIGKDGPGLEDASVDRVLIVNTWHHISGREAYARALAKVLKTGGSVVIVDFKLESDKGPPKEHKLAAGAIVKELEAGGLSASVDQATLPDQYIITAKVP